MYYDVFAQPTQLMAVGLFTGYCDHMLICRHWNNVSSQNSQSLNTCQTGMN